MMLAARNAFLMGGAGPTPPPLPYDAEVEYLLSDRTNYGAAYINTGINPDTSTSINLTFQAIAATGFIFGSEVAWGNNAFAIYQRNTGTFTAEFGSTQNFTVAAPLAKNAVALSSSGASVGASSIAFSRSISSNPNAIYLFTSNRAGTALTGNNMGRGSISDCQIRKGGVLVRDLIPVRVGSGSSAVGYLFDRANPTGGPLGNGLYGNAADGQGGKAGFPANCIGPDK